MFFLKQQILEAGNNLKNTLEIKAANFQPYISQNTFAFLGVSDVFDLFIQIIKEPFSICGGCNIKVNVANSAEGNKSKKIKKSNKISSSFTHLSSRVESFSFRTQKSTFLHDNNSETSIEKVSDDRLTAQMSEEIGVFRFKLTRYWIEWQRSALLSGFDFDFARMLKDAREVRFYEFTKLWRVSRDMKEGDSLPNKIEITYGQFTSLMPLAKFRSKNKIAIQINELVKPLKSTGYIKSFSIKRTSSHRANYETSLIFRFCD